MHLLFEAFIFGIAVAAMFVGLLGIILPILPGVVLIWLTVLAYAVFEGFSSIGWITFTVITLIALVASTVDIWMPVVGSKKGGASKRAILLGLLGGLLGFFLLTPIMPVVGSIFGGIIGYAVGTLIGQYHKYRDWNLAVKASVGGITGWGLSLIVQMIGGMLIMAIFLWQVLTF